MRVLSPSALAAIQSRGDAALVLLVEMDFSPLPLNICTAPFSLTFNGITYSGTSGLGKVSAISGSVGDPPQLGFELAGISSDAIALALGGSVQGFAARMKLAILGSGNPPPVLDVRQIWSGELDTMSIDDNGATCTIAVSAETVGIDFQRVGDSPYNDIEQQRLHPGDLAFQFVNDQVEQRIVWPLRQWFVDHPNA